MNENASRIKTEVNELVLVQIRKFKDGPFLTPADLDECNARFVRIRKLYEDLDRIRGSSLDKLHR